MVLLNVTLQLLMSSRLCATGRQLCMGKSLTHVCTGVCESRGMYGLMCMGDAHVWADLRYPGGTVK